MQIKTAAEEAKELRKLLNKAIKEDKAVSVLSQYLKERHKIQSVASPEASALLGKLREYQPLDEILAGLKL